MYFYLLNCIILSNIASHKSHVIDKYLFNILVSIKWVEKDKKRRCPKAAPKALFIPSGCPAFPLQVTSKQVRKRMDKRNGPMP